jgi:hypothetical protein
MKLNRRQFIVSSATGLAGATVSHAASPAAQPARGRTQATPLAQDFTTVFHHDDRERYIEGCGLVRMDDGSFVAVVPIVPRLEWNEARRATQSRAHVMHSGDGGRTWRKQSELPYYSAIPWVHAGRLHLFANKGGTKYRNDDLLLLRSEDAGRTWSKPVTLFAGHFWNCHTGMVRKNGRIYVATDDLALGSKRGPLVFVGDLSADLMNPRSWRRSEPVPFPGVPDAMLNEKFKDLPSQYLEPNVVEVNGRIRVLATVKARRQTSAGFAAAFDLTDDGAKLQLKFSQYTAMPGGQLKFCVIRDDVSGLFWATANLVVDSQGAFDWWTAPKRGKFWGFGDAGGNDRRFLMLLYSVDALNWFQAGCVAQARKISQSFMYGTLVVDGADLAVISRTCIDAPNQHDADYATFHRVRDFRQLALNLMPEPE